MLFRRRRANYSELRKKAVSLTRHELSSRLLSRFEALVYHPGMSGNTDVHYQDREILGAVCCTPAEAMLMHHAARLCNPLHPIEIGSYIGWSSAHIASGIDRSVLTCVDPFLESGRLGEAGEVSASRAHARFLENMARAGLAEKVRLVRGRSPDVFPEISSGHRWDFIFVDGWHLQGQPVRDVAGVLPYASDDAVLLLHDLWIPDVRDAFLFLVTQGWSYRLFWTSNYLAILWRGAQRPWLAELFEIAAGEDFVLPAAEGRQLFVGLTEDSITALQRAYAGGKSA